MHSPEVLADIYLEHGYSAERMAETLIGLDVDLLNRMPWSYLANRIAVEREHLGLSAVHPFLHWKLPPPPPDWLTPALIVKMFDLALSDEYEYDPDASECADRSELVLPA